MHVPVEWLAINMDSRDILQLVYDATENYYNLYNTYIGFTFTLNKVEAGLRICDATKKWWYRRIEVDHRPPHVDYYPSLQPEPQMHGDSGIAEN
ncbi:hypothetical protein PV327_011602 [Microctonus hyperodae]|uniref:Uncharacterized protein n=1 Tax=Microctonus hyperodae TaxID=165561 RepID=A0AA39KPR4_MICHY|nr:hypothetical protein PV327_011602 [Microctonus hyperodae]